MDKAEVAKVAYQEVLDATKHQDDKVGRIITAAAFLTTGAIALVTHTYATSVVLQLPNGSVPIVSICIGIFLASTTFSVIALLVSLATPHVYLSERPDHVSTTNEPYQSLIFFHEIGRLSTATWEECWKKNDSELTNHLIDNYIAESLNLARRVKLKYRRTYDALRYLDTGIFYLSLGVISYLIGFSVPVQTAGQPHSLAPTYLNRSILFVGLIVFLLIQVVAIRDQAQYNRSDFQSPGMSNDRVAKTAATRLCDGTLLFLAWLEASLLLTPSAWTRWLVFVVAIGGILIVLRFPRREYICSGGAETSTVIDGGKTRSGLSRRTFYKIVGLTTWIAGVSIALAVSISGTGLSRFVAAASLPILVLLVGSAQRAIPYERWFERSPTIASRIATPDQSEQLSGSPDVVANK